MKKADIVIGEEYIMDNSYPYSTTIPGTRVKFIRFDYDSTMGFVDVVEFPNKRAVENWHVDLKIYIRSLESTIQRTPEEQRKKKEEAIIKHIQDIWVRQRYYKETLHGQKT